jgi:phage-related protein
MNEPIKKHGGYLIIAGEQFDIIAAISGNGKSPFFEYFNTLKEEVTKRLKKGSTNHKDVMNFKTIQFYFEKFSKNGKWGNKTQLNSLDDGFWEFKNVDTGLRVPFYYDENNRKVIILTHYFEKKSQKTPPKEIERMRQIKKEFEAYRRLI